MRPSGTHFGQLWACGRVMACALALCPFGVLGLTNHPSKPGFPVILAGAGTLRNGAPVIADLGFPGGKSIVLGTLSGNLYVVKRDGTLAAGFPVTLPAEIISSPAVADLNGDTAPDIVVGYGSYFGGPTSTGKPGGMRAYSRTGTMLWDRPSGDWNLDLLADPVYGAPAIGDMDGDGAPEVVWIGIDGYLYAVRGDTGANKPGWPKFTREQQFSSPALFDIDGDGRLDIVVGQVAHFEGAPYNTPDGGCLRVFRYDGSEVVGFPRCIDQEMTSSPAIGDIDGDGRPDIVIGTGKFFPNRSHRVYAFRCDGTAVPGWPAPVDGEVASSPALADVDGDGTLDVIVTDDSSGPDAMPHVYALKTAGGVVSRLFKVVPLDYFGGHINAGNPIVADVLGNADLEILVPVNGEICVLSKTGVQLTEHANGSGGLLSFATQTALSNAAVDDFEGDGASIEVVAVSGTPFPTGTDMAVNVFNPTKTAPAVSGPWGMFRQNARRTGVAPGAASCPNANPPLRFYTLTPCRVLDTRDSTLGPFGAPKIGANRSRVFSVIGRCGIPADARALSVNLAVVNPTTSGTVRLFAGSGSSPNALVLLYSPGQTRATQAMVQLGAGELSIQVDQFSGDADAVLDVNGYYK